MVQCLFPSETMFLVRAKNIRNSPYIHLHTSCALVGVIMLNWGSAVSLGCLDGIMDDVAGVLIPIFALRLVCGVLNKSC